MKSLCLPLLALLTLSACSRAITGPELATDAGNNLSLGSAQRIEHLFALEQSYLGQPRYPHDPAYQQRLRQLQPALEPVIEKHPALQPLDEDNLLFDGDIILPRNTLEGAVTLTLLDAQVKDEDLAQIRETIDH